MKMYENQANLPRLPLPALEDTCRKLLEWSQPLLSSEDYDSSKKAVDYFISSEGKGPFLQKKLTALRNRKDTLNWLEPFWYGTYLGNRLPLPVNSNVAFVLEKNIESRNMPQAEFSANLLVSLFEYRNLLYSGNMDIDFQGKNALCMSQYKTLLGTARIPGQELDILKTVNDSNHVAVIANGRYYKINAPFEADIAKNYTHFYNSIKMILKKSETEGNFPVGCLTSTDRTSWAKNRNNIIELDPSNADSLNQIEGALAILALDSNEYESDSQMFKNMLCGNSRNRWYDKSIQLILSRDGHFAINYEHSGVDGTTLGNLVRFIYKNTKPHEEIKEGYVAHEVEEICFTLDGHIKNEIEKAEAESEKAFNGLSIEVLLFDKFGKTRIKESKTSPDSFIQIAFQLAQMKTFGKVSNTYEAVMTKQFLHGRTEAMRPVTPESIAFANEPTSDNFRKAMAKHIERISECKNGYGIDRHLFGLKKMHEENFPGDDLPEIFYSPSYREICRNFFSTSTSNPKGLLHAGYGPVIEDGYGLRYLIYGDELHFVLSSKVHNSGNLLKLKSNLEESLIEIASILESE